MIDSVAINQILILFLQCFVVASLILFLFRLRTIFGLSLLFVALGVFQYMQVFLAASLYVEVFPGIMISPGSMVMFTGSLFAVLLIYIREDALEARKVIYALLAVNFALALLQFVFSWSIDNENIINIYNLPKEFFLVNSRVLLIGTIVLFIDAFSIIFIYEAVSSYLSSLFLRILISMILIVSIDSVLFAVGAFAGTDEFSNILVSGLLSKVSAAIIYSILFSLYLLFVEKGIDKHKTSTLAFEDIFYTLTYRQKYEQVFEEKEIQKLALQKSKILNKTLIAHLPQRIFVKDLNSVYLSCNQNYATDLGTTPSEMIGKNDFDYFPSDLAKAYRADDQVVISQGETKKIEEKYLLKGEERWIRTIKVPYRDSENHIIGILGVFEDITERKQAEEKLKESEERYRLMLNTTLDGFILADEEGKIMQVNPSYCAMIGYSEQELISMNIRNIEAKLSDQEVKDRIQQMVSQGNARFETRHQAKDGHFIDLEVSVSILQNDKKTPLVAAFVRNITERKQAEEKLKANNQQLQASEQQLRAANQQLQATEQELRVANKNFKESETNLKEAHSNLQALLDNRIDSIWSLDRNYNFLVYNKPYADVIYSNMGIRLEKGMNALEIHPKEVNDFWKPKFDEALDGNYVTFEFSHVLDGKEHFFEVYLNPIYTDNKIIGLSALSMDITSRKQAEKEVLLLNKELEQRVINRTAQLEASNKELEAFSYSVSHDLRAPLRAIDGFTGILLEDYVEKLDDEGKRLGDVIRKNAQKMGKLIDDLLAFSRLGRASMQFSSIDMKNMATAIYHEATSSSERKRIKFSVADLPDAYGDTNMFRQVWMNLISNAIKFSSKREKAHISITSVQDEENITYRISDNGAGFDMQYVNKVFDVFQRLHRDNEYSGTGVGLSLVQRIIHRHKGNIWAEGEVDKGATFYFSLPKKEINETNEL